MNVGVSLSRLALVLFFFVARWDLEWPDDAVRLLFSSLEEAVDAGTLCALEWDAVRTGCVAVTAGLLVGLGLGLSAMSSDSGTSLNSMGCELGPMPAPIIGPRDGPAMASSLPFGKLLAAAAHERSVVRDARSAASLSAWYDGDL